MQNEIAFISNLITDIQGAITILKERTGNEEYNRQTVHYHVQKGNIRAFIFLDMDIVQWDKNNPEHRKGKEYIFLKQDIHEMPIHKRKPKESNS